MSKFVKICTSRSPHTPNCPHPTIGNVSLPPHSPPHRHNATNENTPTPPQSPTFPHNHPHSETLNFPQKLNYLVSNTPKLNNFNNLVA